MLRSASFRWLLASGIATYLGMGMQLTATAWLAVDAAGGALAVGLVLAARMLPNLLFGLASGTIADRGNRHRLLVGVRVLALPPTLGLAWLARFESVEVWQLMLLSFAAGCTWVFDLPARQALVLDTVPREVAPNAMALNATVGRLCTALGAFAAGALIPTAGVAACFVATAVLFVVAAVVGLLVRPASTPRADSTPGQRPSFGRALREGLRLVVDAPQVRPLLVATVACEVFGFSYQTAVPAFARDVLDAGAEGLGMLTAAASLGGAAAMVLLALLPGRFPRQPLLGVVFVLYGASMLLLAPSNSVSIAAAALLITGACAASFDLLQQTLVQLAVPEEQRGRAVGLWVLGIGSAPLGNLVMGTSVAVLGAPIALAINGGLVLLAAAVLLVSSPRYRPRASWTRSARQAGPSSEREITSTRSP
jgi:MFS family permease